METKEIKSNIKGFIDPTLIAHFKSVDEFADWGNKHGYKGNKADFELLYYQVHEKPKNVK